VKIKLENVNYIYNPNTIERVEAVSEVNLEFQDNSFVAVIGGTGSGKSTLIQMLNGLLEPTSGQILYDGVAVYDQSKNKKELQKDLRKLRCRVGLVFQYPEYQLFEETVLKDVAYGPKNQGLSEEEAERKAVEALKQVGVREELFDQSPFELSGGEKRRVAIAGVLAMKPDVLILDEPSAGLDPLGKKNLLNTLKKYKEENNVTVILVSHSMEEVAEYAERVVALKKGRVVLDGNTRDVFKQKEKLLEIGLGVPEVTLFAESLGLEGIITVGEACSAILQ